MLLPQDEHRFYCFMVTITNVFMSPGDLEGFNGGGMLPGQLPRTSQICDMYAPNLQWMIKHSEHLRILQIVMLHDMISSSAC